MRPLSNKLEVLRHLFEAQDPVVVSHLDEKVNYYGFETEKVEETTVEPL